MVCLSLHGTIKVKNRLSDDHDVDLLFWSNHFSDAVKVIYNKQSHISLNKMEGILTDNNVYTNDDYTGDDYEDGSAAAILLNSLNAEYLHTSDTTDGEMDSDEPENSIIAPQFSLICDEPLENFSTLKDDNDVVSSSEDEEVSKGYTSTTTLTKRDTVGGSDNDAPLQEAC